MRLAKDLLGGYSDLLRLLARTSYLKLSRWDFFPFLFYSKQDTDSHTVTIQGTESRMEANKTN